MKYGKPNRDNSSKRSDDFVKSKVSKPTPKGRGSKRQQVNQLVDELLDDEIAQRLIEQEEINFYYDEYE